MRIRVRKKKKEIAQQLPAGDPWLKWGGSPGAVSLSGCGPRQKIGPSLPHAATRAAANKTTTKSLFFCGGDFSLALTLSFKIPLQPKREKSPLTLSLPPLLFHSLGIAEQQRETRTRKISAIEEGEEKRKKAQKRKTQSGGKQRNKAPAKIAKLFFLRARAKAWLAPVPDPGLSVRSPHRRAGQSPRPIAMRAWRSGTFASGAAPRGAAAGSGSCGSLPRCGED